jgi:SAM-dependent methyltransferase
MTQAAVNYWEGFARRNAEYYVLTLDGVAYDTPEGMEYFFGTGREQVEAILADSAPWRGARVEVALEIGCGVGRLTLPMSRRFGNVLAVDIAPTMLEKLERHATRAGVGNVRTFVTAGPWDAQGRVDFAYSRWTFQHIEDFAAIDDYLRRVAGCLADDGAFYLQLNTLPRTLSYHLRNAAPDALLPRLWRRGVRSLRRRPAELRAAFARHGFRIARELRPDTADHAFILVPAARRA